MERSGLGLLPTAPRRFELAEENDQRDYEIRRMLVGDYLALYSIDDEQSMVRVIGFRRGQQLPRVDELPDEL